MLQVYVAGSTYDRLHYAYSYVTIEYLPPINVKFVQRLFSLFLTINAMQSAEPRGATFGDERRRFLWTQQIGHSFRLRASWRRTNILDLDNDYSFVETRQRKDKKKKKTDTLYFSGELSLCLMLRIIIATFRNKIYAKISIRVFESTVSRVVSGDRVLPLRRKVKPMRNRSYFPPSFFLATDIPAPVHPYVAPCVAVELFLWFLATTHAGWNAKITLGHPKSPDISRIVESLNFLMHQPTLLSGERRNA